MPISSVPGTEKARKKPYLLFLTEPIISTGVTWYLKRKSGRKGSPLGAAFPESRSQRPLPPKGTELPPGGPRLAVTHLRLLD